MKKKYLRIITLLIIIIIWLMPIAFAVNDKNESSLGETEAKKYNESTDEIDDIVEQDDENKENEGIKDENIKNETIEENRQNLNEEFSIGFQVNGITTNSYHKDKIYYLFVPKGVKLSEIEISYTGIIDTIDIGEFDNETKKITGEFEDNSEFTITLEDGQTKRVKIMQSDVPAIYINDLTIKDGNNIQSKTIEDVNTGSKEIKYNATLTVTGCDNTKDNISQTIEFKGRGNTSWIDMPKKSYQIKLNKKANFLGIGNSKEKKWVLIANYEDPTLLKNKIMNDLCVNSNLSSCPNSSFADLYVDGNYIGNYLIADKIEINENRISLTDEKGILAELDNVYYKDEEYYIRTKRGKYYAIKEAVSEKDEEKIIESINTFKDDINQFEDELYSSNPSWHKISEMIDIESFAKYYLINEFAENTDSYLTSCYLYKNGDNDVIHMGPTWDYDKAFAYYSNMNIGNNPSQDFTLDYQKNHNNGMEILYNFPQFANLVNEIYSKVVKLNLDKIDVNEMSKKIEKSININTIVWSNKNTYEKRKKQLEDFIEKRKDYYSSRYSNKQVEYSTHVQNIGWTRSINSGISGTEGQSFRLEGIRISLGTGFEDNMNISYKTHVQNLGWQDWVDDGKLAGTVGNGWRLEAIAIKLNNSKNYSVRYRVHVENIGWQDWAYDGEIAGTEGNGWRLEAIEIQIVPKCYYLGKKEKEQNELINYKGHIQNIGDTGYASDGEIIGTIGRGYRIEGIKFELSESISRLVSLEIDEHIENIGWKYGLTDKDYIGTKGNGFRIEAIKINVKGEEKEKYTIRYRTHVENIGWQDWKENGELAGTEGQGLRIEAIQVELVEK